MQRINPARECDFSPPPILPRWLSNQWFTDSLVGHANFHFLQCRARGAKLPPRTDFRACLLTAASVRLALFLTTACVFVPSLFSNRNVGTPSRRRFHPVWSTVLCVSGGVSPSWLTAAHNRRPERNTVPRRIDKGQYTTRRRLGRAAREPKPASLRNPDGISNAELGPSPHRRSR
jgi:hypothetical protein